MAREPSSTPAERVPELERTVEALQLRLAGMEQRLTESQVRFNASVRFFEHRVDQIYGRVLEGLGADLFACESEPVAPRAAEAIGFDVTERMRLQIGASSDHLPPARYLPPLTSFGFRLALGAATERDGAVEIGSHPGKVVLFGPYKRLVPGRYEIRWTLAPFPEAGSGASLGFDVYSPTLDRAIADAEHHGPLDEPTVIVLDAIIGAPEVDALLEFRVIQRSSTRVRVTAFEFVRTGD